MKDIPIREKVTYTYDKALNNPTVSDESTADEVVGKSGETSAGSNMAGRNNLFQIILGHLNSDAKFHNFGLQYLQSLFNQVPLVSAFKNYIVTLLL